VGADILDSIVIVADLEYGNEQTVYFDNLSLAGLKFTNFGNLYPFTHVANSCCKNLSAN
jgi:hypothetical protein